MQCDPAAAAARQVESGAEGATPQSKLAFGNLGNLTNKMKRVSRRAEASHFLLSSLKARVCPRGMGGGGQR